MQSIKGPTHARGRTLPFVGRFQLKARMLRRCHCLLFVCRQGRGTGVYGNQTEESKTEWDMGFMPFNTFILWVVLAQSINQFNSIIIDRLFFCCCSISNGNYKHAPFYSSYVWLVFSIFNFISFMSISYLYMLSSRQKKLNTT